MDEKTRRYISKPDPDYERMVLDLADAGRRAAEALDRLSERQRGHDPNRIVDSHFVDPPAAPAFPTAAIHQAIEDRMEKGEVLWNGQYISQAEYNIVTRRQFNNHS